MNSPKCVWSTSWCSAFALLALTSTGACSSKSTPDAARQTPVTASAGSNAPSTTVAGSGSPPSRNLPSSSNAGLITPATTATTPTMSTGMSPSVITVVPIEPIVIDECGANNAAGLSPDDLNKVRAGGPPSGDLRWLYPYDGTVFPRGMVAPDLMWDGPSADTVFVHIKAKAFEYFGCLKTSRPGAVTLSQNVWDEAGKRTGGKQDEYTLELTVLPQGNASSAVGPVVSHFLIAQATIKGSIYYNSYSSMLSPNSMAGGGMPGGGMPGIPGAPGGGLPGVPGAPPGIPGAPGGGGFGGAILRIPAGGRAEIFAQVNCDGCHSVSADGSRLLSQSIGGATSYQLASNGMSSAPVAAGPRGAFGALYPDGSVYLSMSTVISVARTAMTSDPTAAPDAALVDAATGQVVPSTGIPTGALMPMFSPDGTYLVFNDYAIDQAHGLALMRYDNATRTASDYRMLATEPAGSMRPGWPFILPDNKAVVFVRTDGGDFSGNGAGVSGMVTPGLAPSSDLYIVDVASGTVTLLAKAMGYATPADAEANTTYLPFGAEELHATFFPTMSPVAGGGYFWVFFDAARHYGNLGMQRQLWGAAIDISPDGTYTIDSSHPAFYLTGQEFGTGNHRAFAALDPCRQDGDSCTSGIDCCGGFCYVEGQGQNSDAAGSCTPKKMQECAKLDERCQSDADCCPPAQGEQANVCIAGYCAMITQPS